MGQGMTPLALMVPAWVQVVETRSQEPGAKVPVPVRSCSLSLLGLCFGCSLSLSLSHSGLVDVSALTLPPPDSLSSLISLSFFLVLCPISVLVPVCLSAFSLPHLHYFPFPSPVHTPSPSSSSGSLEPGCPTSFGRE